MGKARWIAAGGATALMAALAVPGMTRQAQVNGLIPETPAEAAPVTEAGPALPPAAIVAAAKDAALQPIAVSAPAPGSVAVGVTSASPAPVTAAPAKAEPAPRDPNVGPVTGMPLPRFVSLKGNEGNARRGPGLTHRIDWVFKVSGMPLRITAEYEHWRKVEDSEGVGGWVHYSLLSGVRSVQVAQDMAEFRDGPDQSTEVLFQAEIGVIAKLLECTLDWCRVSVQGEKGWVQKTALWGVKADEVLE